MKTLLAAPIALIAAPAMAHTGHVAAEAGHSHWLALAFFSLAVAIGGALAWREVKARAARSADRKAGRKA